MLHTPLHLSFQLLRGHFPRDAGEAIVIAFALVVAGTFHRLVGEPLAAWGRGQRRVAVPLATPTAPLPE